MNETGSKVRVFSTLIICIGLVVSVWLINRSAKIKPPTVVKSQDLMDLSVATNTNQGNEWMKQLNTIQGNTKITDLTQSHTDITDDTTITNQMTIDIMSRYLALKSGGQEVTQAQMDKIISDVMADPTYTKTATPIYVSSNLKITEKNDYNTVKTYKDKVNASIKKALSVVTEDPASIVEKGIKSGSENDLKKLDPYINANMLVIKELLSMTVPKDGVGLHLRLLNSLSNTLTDLESIRAFGSDPVKSFPAISQFNTHIRELLDSINAMGGYKPK